MTSSVLANSKYLQGRLLALIDPTREANRVLIARCARLEVQSPPATRFFGNQRSICRARRGDQTLMHKVDKVEAVDIRESVVAAHQQRTARFEQWLR
jgi:hypothetical protein